VTGTVLVHGEDGEKKWVMDFAVSPLTKGTAKEGGGGRLVGLEKDKTTRIASPETL